MTATRKSAAHSQADLPRPQQVDLFEPILVGGAASREVAVHLRRVPIRRLSVPAAASWARHFGTG